MISQTKISDFNKKIDVVACYIQHDGKFVMLQRLPHKSSGNQWGLPAGKVDPGETIEQAVKREIWEETGLEVQENALKHLGSLYVRNLETDIYYDSFILTLDEKPKITIRPTEHQAFKWVTPEESLKMDMVHDLVECNKLYFKI